MNELNPSRANKSLGQEFQDLEAFFNQFKDSTQDATPKNETSRTVVSPEHILEIRRRGIGLRTTPAAELDRESSQGVYGDFLVISNLAELLTVPEDMLEEFYQKVKALNMEIPEVDFIAFARLYFIQHDLQRLLKANPHLAQDFTLGIKRHIVDSLDRYLSGSFFMDDLVKKFFTATITTRLPALILIEKGSLNQQPRDVKTYYPFGKFGMGEISPEMMIAQIRITPNDADFLAIKARFKSVMDKKMIDLGESGTELLEELNQSLLDLYIQRIINALFSTP